MEILGRKLSDRTEAIYKRFEQDLVYPVTFLKQDPGNQDDLSRPVAMDTGKKEFIIKIDSDLEDRLFENALIRDMIYCFQMSSRAPVLSAVDDKDLDAYQVGIMVSSVIMDIDVENKLTEYDMHLDDIDTMRLADLFSFLKSGMSDYNRALYHVLTGLQITLLLFTSSNKKNIEDIVQTFYLSDPEGIEIIDKFVSIIERYGVSDNRSMMRCMRKIGLACGMKGRLNLEYEGKVTVI